MKFKKLIYLFMILILLAGAAVLKKMGAEKKERSEQSAATALESLFKGFDPAAVQSIGLKIGESEEPGVVLAKKEDGSWFMPGHFNSHAKKWAVEDLLKKIADAKGEVRSETPDVIGDYGLASDKALHIWASGAQDKVLAHLLVGSERTPFGQNFIRRDGSDRVIVSKEDILLSAGLRNKEAKPDFKYFVDMRVASIEVSQAVKIEFSDKKAAWTLAKKDAQVSAAWGWDPPEPADEVDAEKVSTLLRSVAGLSGKEVLDPKASSYGFEAKPWLRITQTKDGIQSETSLFLGTLDKTKKSYALRVLPDDVVYEVADTAVDGVKTEKAEFYKTKK